MAREQEQLAFQILFSLLKHIPLQYGIDVKHQVTDKNFDVMLHLLRIKARKGCQLAAKGSSLRGSSLQILLN